MICMVHRTVLLIHILFLLRNQSSLLSSTPPILISSSSSSTKQFQQVLVSAFHTVVPPQRQRQYQPPPLQHHNRLPNIDTKFVIFARPRRMNIYESSLSQVAHSQSIDNTSDEHQRPAFDDKHVEKVLFVECGFGSDAHGQNSTKAAVRACRNAIEFNQIPCIGELIPGGRENMKLDVLLGVPIKYQNDLDLHAIRQCFPYGTVHIQCPTDGGGLLASSGKVIAEMGDTNDDMIIVCVAVTVGY